MKKKAFLILLTILMTIFTIYKIVEIYGVFYSEWKSSSEMNLAKWNVSVNDNDVKSGATQNFVIEKITIVNPIHSVKEGKLAPSLDGYFEFTIDPQDTQVSIRYDITVDVTGLEGHSLKLASITEENLNKQLIRTDKNTYTATILLDDSRDVNKIKLDFEWPNIETNNEKDTELGINATKKVKVPISVRFTQYFGEEIEEYTE